MSDPSDELFLEDTPSSTPHDPKDESDLELLDQAVRVRDRYTNYGGIAGLAFGIAASIHHFRARRLVLRFMSDCYRVRHFGVDVNAAEQAARDGIIWPFCKCRAMTVGAATICAFMGRSIGHSMAKNKLLTDTHKFEALKRHYFDASELAQPLHVTGNEMAKRSITVYALLEARKAENELNMHLTYLRGLKILEAKSGRRF